MNPSDTARYIGAAPTWLNQNCKYGSMNNPPDATIIVDTGQLAAGYYDIFYFWSATAALAYGNLFFEWRNAANDDYIWLQYIISSGVITDGGFLLGVKVALNERFRFNISSAFVGRIACSLVAVRRA